MNPYKILNIGAASEKRDIVQAAALALRERSYSAKEIAMAQRELLDPVSGAAHRFPAVCGFGSVSETGHVQVPGSAAIVRFETVENF